MYQKPELEIIVLEEVSVITNSLINGGEGSDQEIELPDL